MIDLFGYFFHFFVLGISMDNRVGIWNLGILGFFQFMGVTKDLING